MSTLQSIRGSLRATIENVRSASLRLNPNATFHSLATNPQIRPELNELHRHVRHEALVLNPSRLHSRSLPIREAILAPPFALPASLPRPFRTHIFLNSHRKASTSTEKKPKRMSDPDFLGPHPPSLDLNIIIPENDQVVKLPDDIPPDGVTVIAKPLHPIPPPRYRSLEMMFRESGIRPSVYSDLLEETKVPVKPEYVITSKSMPVVYFQSEPVNLDHKLRTEAIEAEGGVFRRLALLHPLQQKYQFLPGGDPQEYPKISDIMRAFPGDRYWRPMHNRSVEDFDLEWMKHPENYDAMPLPKSVQWITYQVIPRSQIAYRPGFYIIRPRLPPPLMSAEERKNFLLDEFAQCEMRSILNPVYVMPGPWGWPVIPREQVLKNPYDPTNEDDIEPHPWYRDDAPAEETQPSVTIAPPPVIKDKEKLEARRKTSKLPPREDDKKKKGLTVVNATKRAESRIEQDTDSDTDGPVVMSKKRDASSIIIDTKDLYDHDTSDSSDTDGDFSDTPTTFDTASYPYAKVSTVPRGEGALQDGVQSTVDQTANGEVPLPGPELGYHDFEKFTLHNLGIPHVDPIASAKVLLYDANGKGTREGLFAHKVDSQLAGLPEIDLSHLSGNEREMAELVVERAKQIHESLVRHHGEKIGEYPADTLFYRPVGKTMVMRAFEKDPPASTLAHPDYKYFVHWHYWPEYRARYADRYPLLEEHLRLPSPHIWIAIQLVKLWRLVVWCWQQFWFLMYKFLKFIVDPSGSKEFLKKIWESIVHEVKHFGTGFKLLSRDASTAFKLVRKGINGTSLTRRERKHLIRTSADLMRLVPFIVIVIVPFMELALPLLIKIFPNMLPSTFKDEKQELEKIRAELRAKLFVVDFVQDAVEVYSKEALERKKRRQTELSARIRDEADTMMASTERVEGGLPFHWKFDRRGRPVRLPSDNMTVAEAEELVNLIESLPPLPDEDEPTDGKSMYRRMTPASHFNVRTTGDVNLIFDNVRAGKIMLTKDELLDISNRFKNDPVLVLENLSRSHLISLCKHIKISTSGNLRMIRERLRHTFDDIRKDDEVIIAEGVENLEVEEAKEACRDRGMRFTGLTNAGYRRNIETWLLLTQKHNVPVPLVMLSRVLIMHEGSEDDEQPAPVPSTFDDVPLPDKDAATLDEMHAEEKVIEEEHQLHHTTVAEAEALERQLLEKTIQEEEARRKNAGIEQKPPRVEREEQEILSPLDANDLAQLTETLSLLASGDPLLDVKNKLAKLKQDQDDHERELLTLGVKVDKDGKGQDADLPMDEAIRRRRELKELRKAMLEDDADVENVARVSRSVGGMLDRLEARLEQVSSQLPNIKVLDKDGDGLVTADEIKDVILQLRGGHTEVEAELLVLKLQQLAETDGVVLSVEMIHDLAETYGAMAEDEKVAYLAEQTAALHAMRVREEKEARKKEAKAEAAGESKNEQDAADVKVTEANVAETKEALEQVAVEAQKETVEQVKEQSVETPQAAEKKPSVDSPISEPVEKSPEQKEGVPETKDDIKK